MSTAVLIYDEIPDSLQIGDALSSMEACRADRGTAPSVRGRNESFGAQVIEELNRVGFDKSAVERALDVDRRQNKLRRDRLHADAIAQSAARSESLRQVALAQRSALGAVVVNDRPHTEYIVLDTPGAIGHTAGVNVESFTVQQHETQVKMRLDQQAYSDGGLVGTAINDFLSFTYFWRNAETTAVVSAQALLNLNGHCSVSARGGIQPDGTVDLKLKAALEVVSPPQALPQSGQTLPVWELAADTGWFSGDVSVSKDLFNAYQPAYQDIVVAPGEFLVIDVRLIMSGSIVDGEAHADFASGEFFVRSNFVALTAYYPGIVVHP
jgi:hypothetical protein